MRRLFVCLLYLGLVGRVLVPAGYMIASASEGWPIKLCPELGGGLSGAPREGTSHAAHHSSPWSDPGDRGEEQPCPVGALFAMAAEVDAAELVVVLSEAGWSAPAAAAPTALQRADATRSRGPPLPLSLAA